MKKNILLLSFIFLISGCVKNDKTTNQQNKISERKQNLINITKRELNSRGYIDENLKNFNVEKVYLDGYYKNDSNKKFFEIDFNYSCKNNKDDCVKDIGYKSDDGNTIIWIYTNEDENIIYDINKGISISYKDVNSGNYVRIGEIID